MGSSDVSNLKSPMLACRPLRHSALNIHHLSRKRSPAISTETVLPDQPEQGQGTVPKGKAGIMEEQGRISNLGFRVMTGQAPVFHSPPRKRGCRPRHHRFQHQSRQEARRLHQSGELYCAWESSVLGPGFSRTAAQNEPLTIKD